MNKILKGNNRFVADFNRSVEESKKQHPEPETIHLYAMKALPKKRMEELKEHFDYCWHCVDILVDAEELQQISEEADAGILKEAVTLPSFDSLYEKAFGKSEQEIPTTVKPFQEYLGNLIRFLFGELSPAGSDDILNFYYEAQWSGKERPLYFWKVKRGFKVLTPDAELIGKFIVIKDRDEKNEIKAEFISDDFTQEGMKARAFLRIEEGSDFNELKEKYKSSKEMFLVEISDS